MPSLHYGSSLRSSSISTVPALSCNSDNREELNITCIEADLRKLPEFNAEATKGFCGFLF